MQRALFDEHGNPNGLCLTVSYLLTAVIVWIPFLFLMPAIWTIAVALIVAVFLYKRLPWMDGVEVEPTSDDVQRDERYNRLMEHRFFQEKDADDGDESAQ